jgi:hypothetical protein
MYQQKVKMNCICGWGTKTLNDTKNYEIVNTKSYMYQQKLVINQLLNQSPVVPVPLKHKTDQNIYLNTFSNASTINKALSIGSK